MQDPSATGLFSYSQLHMGVRVNLRLYAPDQGTAEHAAIAAYTRYAELEQVFSDYRADSELMLLCKRAGSGPVTVSRELFDVLARAQELAEKSDGAFDVTASPIIRLWREARRSKAMPATADLASALRLVGWQKMKLNARGQFVDLALPGMFLDLGGIAKGYANDDALAVLRSNGVERAMIQAGGDIGVSISPPNTLGWTVRVAGRSDALYLSNASIATSGDTEQFLEIDGVRYSHVVDPRTGLGVTNRIQATVIAAKGIDSDPLATMLTVMGEDGRRLASDHAATVLLSTKL